MYENFSRERIVSTMAHLLLRFPQEKRKAVYKDALAMIPFLENKKRRKKKQHSNDSFTVPTKQSPAQRSWKPKRSTWRPPVLTSPEGYEYGVTDD
jgi:hypothetical protein